MSSQRDNFTNKPLINWGLVDLPLRRAKEQLAAAREASDFQFIGYQCGEVLIALANAVVGPQPGISAVQAGQLLGTHITKHVSDDARKLALEALATVQRLHKNLVEKRPAAICVESAATLTNVIAIHAGRDDLLFTIAELIERLLLTKKLGQSHRYALLNLAKSRLGQKPASLQPLDVVEHCQQRLDAGTSPATIQQDVVFLRGVLKTAREEWHLEVSTDSIDEAKPLLERLQLVGKSQRRTRRPNRDDLSRLMAYFIEQDKSSKVKIPMAEIMEFALWSGRRISEICSMEWDRVDFENRRYRVDDTHSFPLLGPVWTIIQRQPRVAKRIFPYYSKSASARYTLAKIELGIQDLRLNDLRLEAAMRLRQAGHTVEEIAEVIGRKDLNTLREDLEKAR